ncbi:MAG: spore coat protein [Firmicutes bacterium]|nr:spore coat protein [Bacillota bacterium]
MQPNPQVKTVSDQTIAIDCLLSSKCMAVRDVIGAVECATPELRQAMVHMNQDHLNMARDVFEYLQQRGWYNVPSAESQLVSQFASQYQPPIQGQFATGYPGGIGTIGGGITPPWTQ